MHQGCILIPPRIRDNNCTSLCDMQELVPLMLMESVIFESIVSILGILLNTNSTILDVVKESVMVNRWTIYYLLFLLQRSGLRSAHHSVVLF